MRRNGIAIYVLCYVVFCGLALAGANVTFGAPRTTEETLQVYTTTVDIKLLPVLQGQGYDIIRKEQRGNLVDLELVLWDSQRARLEADGLVLTLKPLPPQAQAGGKTQYGFNVWRSFDEPGGLKDEIYQIARDNPKLVKLLELGRTHQNRPILALKVTVDANKIADGRRPAVYYQSTQHAREWISPEMNRRLLHYVIDQYTSGDAAFVQLLKERELWFVPVLNPDGYQYTFDQQRLWRKNLRDNDGDGQITSADGVDTNRNWPGEKWGWDNEGSSSDPRNLTYRGPKAGSEPEVQAAIRLIKRARPEFMIDYHSFIPGILYPLGWQLDSPSYDDPIFKALAGNTANPAVPGYVSILSSELYTTNGTADDYAYGERDVLAFTVEMGEGTTGSGFVFPDDEALIQAEFEKNLNFALDLARSAGDPTRPSSHLGNTIEPFYIDTFSESYSDQQRVRVNALRRLGDLVLKYQIDGGRVRTTGTFSYRGGERAGSGDDVYYNVRRGTISNLDPGEQVTVWFETEDGRQKSDSFTFLVKPTTEARVLVVAAEDYTGISPAQDASGPKYLQTYLDALAASGIKADVYDVDANGRKAPDALGVLSHYDLVIWETGDDIITRDQGQPPGTASKLAQDLLLEMRQYVDEGGKLIFAGKYAGLQYAANGYIYDPATNTPDPACNPFAYQPNCKLLSDDFLQYYLGAYIYNDDAGTSETGILPAAGLRAPYRGETWEFTPPAEDEFAHSATFIATSGLLPRDEFPQFTSIPVANFIREGGAPFEPFDGSKYVISGQANQSYKRLTTTIDLTDKLTGELTFWASHDLELDWDYFFVEAHTVGQDDWTTLPDANGNTATETGLSCLGNWANDVHPWLLRYQTRSEDGESCTPTGTTGAWNAATGRSTGWQQWKIDLSAYAGKQVEISLAYASDQAVQGLGVFIDKVEVSTGAATSFEAGLDTWTVSGPPAGSPGNGNDFVISEGGSYPEGSIIATRDTFYFGFGLEDVASPEDRSLLLGRAARTLLD